MNVNSCQWIESVHPNTAPSFILVPQKTFLFSKKEPIRGYFIFYSSLWVNIYILVNRHFSTINLRLVFEQRVGCWGWKQDGICNVMWILYSHVPFLVTIFWQIFLLSYFWHLDNKQVCNLYIYMKLGMNSSIRGIERDC